MHKSQSNFIRNIIPPGAIAHIDEATGCYNPFPKYSFTGPLRPVYPLSPRRAVPDRIRLPDYAKDGIPRSEQAFASRHKITILDQKGQAAMRKVCRLAREVLDLAAEAAKPGVTTDEIDSIVHNACLERDVSESFQLKKSDPAKASRSLILNSHTHPL